MRVCLDANVLVAVFATRGLCADVLRAVLTEHELVLGQVIMEELRRVLTDRLKLPVPRLREVESVFAALELVPRPDAPSDIEVQVGSKVAACPAAAETCRRGGRRSQPPLPWISSCERTRRRVHLSSVANFG